LRGIKLARNDLTGWDFSRQNIENASFQASTGFTKDQLYSTASYQQKDLRGVGLGGIDLARWDFGGHDLTRASFIGSGLSNTIFIGARVEGAAFEFATESGFTKEQLYSTASYQTENLQGINLGRNDLSGWNLSGQNLRDAKFHQSNLTKTDFTDSVIDGAWFWGTIEKGFVKEQLYSTASYKVMNLQRIRFSDDLSNWDFRNQNLAGSSFTSCNLTNANLAGANLQSVTLWDAKLKDVDLSGADLRQIQTFPYGASSISRNTIGTQGDVFGLELLSGDILVVRDDDGYSGENTSIVTKPLPVRVWDEMKVTEGGTLKLVLEADQWDSTILFVTGIPVSLGGELELSFAAGVDPTTQVGRTFDLFDWTGVNPTGTFNVVSDYSWDTSRLYTTGEVTLIPEPAPLALLVAAAVLSLALAAPRSLLSRGRS
jgi:uncharacterized protein YjbI with pentapeptide repeats